MMDKTANIRDAGKQKMEYSTFTLRFSGSSACLEDRFMKSFHSGALTQLRITLFFCFIIYGLFGLLDSEILPEVKKSLWIIRYAVICPGVLIALLFTWSRYFLKFIKQTVFLAVVLAGSGIMAMIVIAPPPLSYSYYAGLILVILIGYTMTRVGFICSSAGGWTVIIMYQAVMTLMADIPPSILVRNNFFLISSNIIGMFAAYYIEYYARKGFFITEQLIIEREKVGRANADLEKRVAERTSELTRTNENLRLETLERERLEHERRRLEGRLEQAHKMEAIGTLAGGVAHDLNNILSGLVTLPELILMDLPDGSPIADDLKTIKESGTKAAAIVQDLLTLARRGVAVEEVTNLNSVVSEFLESYELEKIKSWHPVMRFEVELEPDLMNIVGSRVHLLKTVMNLVSNGAEALRSDGIVSIITKNIDIEAPIKGYETVPPGRYVMLGVSDTGEGIAPEFLKRIFEPFFTKKQMGRSGTGLGMTIVLGTLRDHGGYLDVESRENRGTIFKLYFPVTDRIMSDGAAPESFSDHTGNGETILIIDDSPDQRIIASGILEKLNYRVRAVSSGEEAVDYMKTGTADLLLLDMIMEPGMNGLETYGEISRLHPGQKALIASGFSESFHVKNAQALGAGAYLKKPYTMVELAKAVKAELAAKGLQKD